MPGLIIGIIVVIILILGARMWMQTPTAPAPNSGAKNSWKREDGMNYVYGMATPKSSSANVKYLGDFTARDACENKCYDDSWCKAYTWHDATNGGFSNQCFGMSNISNRVEEAGHYSGERVESFDAGAAWNQMRNQVGTFSNTLQRRLGMGSAGATPSESFNTKSCIGTFDCLHNETFISNNDVAAHTMMSGYQRRSTLPG